MSLYRGPVKNPEAEYFFFQSAVFIYFNLQNQWKRHSEKYSLAANTAKRLMG